mgnify:CR=1 FL=1
MREIKRVDERSVVAPTDSRAPAAQPNTGLTRFIWQGRVTDAFWKFATLFSFTVNMILVIVLIFVGWLLFDIKNAIVQPLVGGLYGSFVQMDNSRISTTIQVSDTIVVNDTMPVVFTLPLNTVTTVTLTKAAVIPNTVVYLNNVPVTTNIVLPAGTPLEINLNLSVPVSQTIPVHLNVPVNLSVLVDIALNETDLHTPFSRLRNLFYPYSTLLDKSPSAWDSFLCQTSNALCDLLPR